MASGEARLAVWVGPEEKLVSGLSRRTTCAEVVRALLEESRGRPLGAGPPRASLPEEKEEEEEEEAFCLVERWRGLERALPAQTRLLRLWGAWGAEREHLRFLLRRRPSGPEAASPPGLPGPRSAEARVVPSRQRGPPQDSAGSPGAPLLLRPALNGGSSSSSSQERQRRVVRKAFRKLAKLNRRKGGSSPVQERRRKKEQPQEQEEEEEEEEGEGGQGCRRRASRMAALVQLVLAQDQTLREQSKRLRELDGQIERYEARLHLERMRRHGVNYVQETYLESGAPEEEGQEEEEEEEEEEGQGERGAEQERGEGGCLGPGPGGWAALAALSEERARQEALGESLAAQIQEELNRRWMRRRRQELALAAAACRSASSSPSETDCETTELLGREPLPAEEERLRTQLSTSLYIGLRLSTDLHAAREALEDSHRAWREKERQLRRLLQEEEEQEQQQQQKEQEEEEGCPPEPSGKAGQQQEEEGDGEDSDTGLSSMHSQDSDSGPGSSGGCGASESLV